MNQTIMNQTIANLDVKLQNLILSAKTHARQVAAKGLAESRDIVESSARTLGAIADKLGVMSVTLEKDPCAEETASDDGRQDGGQAAA